MPITEIQETAATTTGSWSSQSAAAASGGAYLQSGGAGASATFGVSGRAIYLLATQRQDGGAFSVGVDGQSYGSASCFAVGTSPRYRVLVPLARGLADGPHSVTLTASSAAPVCIDGLLVVSGVPIVPVAGSLVCLGDSITAGYGLQNSLSGWPSRLAQLLRARLSRPFALTNRGISGDSLFAVDAAHVGGMYRLATEVAPLAPELLTVMFGINDLLLNLTLPGDFIAHYAALLSLIEDTFAVASMAVLVCTPTYVGAQSLSSVYGGNEGGYYAGTAADNYRLSLELLKQLVAMYSWASLAYSYEVMDDTDSLVYPNGGYDSTHPGDAGHSVLAVEVFRAAIERFAAIGKA